MGGKNFRDTHRSIMPGNPPRRGELVAIVTRALPLPSSATVKVVMAPPSSSASASTLPGTGSVISAAKGIDRPNNLNEQVMRVPAPTPPRSTVIGPKYLGGVILVWPSR